MVRFRPLAVAAALSALVAMTVVGGASASNTTMPVDQATIGRGFPHAKVMPALLPNSKENTSIVVQNDGTGPAIIALDIYTPSGVPIPEASDAFENVPVGATRVFNQSLNPGLLPGFRGVGIVSSDQKVLAIQSRDIEENGTGRKAYSLHNAYGEGAMQFSLPYVANQYENVYNTRFAIANAGNTVACVTIEYAFNGGGGHTDTGPGGSGCATGYPVPVGGQVAFGPETNGAEFTTGMPAQTVGELMAATVTSTSAVTVAVDGFTRNLPSRNLASYDGFVVDDAAPTTDDIGTEIAIPVALKVDGFYTQILMSNPGGTDATATITYRRQDGTEYVVTRNIPAGGTNTSSTYGEGGQANADIPEGFQGAASISSTQPISAVVFRGKMTFAGSGVYEDLYTAVNGMPWDRAGTTVKVPLVFRHAYGNNAACQDGAGGSCGYDTSISVIVQDEGTANVEIETIADTTTPAPGCNTAATYNTTQSVTGSYIFYQQLAHGSNNPRIGVVNNGLGANPGCLWGGAVITSSAPILVVVTASNDLNVGDNDGQYNAFVG